MTRYPLLETVLSFWFGTLGLAIFVLMVAVLIALSIQHERMFFLFRKKFPDVARKEIPHAFEDGYWHPEKRSYFYRKKAIPVLKQDEKIWELRQQVVVLKKIVLGIPIVFCVIGLIMGIIGEFGRRH